VTQIGPTKTAYYDQIGQLGISETQGFDGSAIRVSTQHDALGRITYKSRPYYEPAPRSHR
jgi:hypothetical protein